MIVGVGTDIVAVARIFRLLERYADAVAGKILSDEEAETFRRAFGDAISAFSGKENPERAANARQSRAAAAFVAKRFAAKEALAKAFGTGLRAPVLLPAITVRNSALGQPFFAYAPELAEWVEEKHVTAHLSLSDERDFALAFVVLERKAARGEP
ncbi:MAG: holo-ACP synthase [Candidatus Accumulibacter sp.]|jgi:holo-[acyl-carrier protein] synthase|nr:holo-ACP synthase [Accumulibacter sp.]